MKTRVTDQNGDTIDVTVLESAGLTPTLVTDGHQELRLNNWDGKFYPV
jgi:hypothetical protein